MGTGIIGRFYTISCGSCDEADWFAPEVDQGRSDAARHWHDAGWRPERPDNEHREPWWQCRDCSRRVQ